MMSTTAAHLFMQCTSLAHMHMYGATPTLPSMVLLDNLGAAAASYPGQQTAGYHPCCVLPCDCVCSLLMVSGPHFFPSSHACSHLLLLKRQQERFHHDGMEVHTITSRLERCQGVKATKSLLQIISSFGEAGCALDP